jgi:hypothetical protein
MRGHLSEDLGVDGRIIFKCILGKLGVGCELDLSGSGKGPVA